MLAPVEVWARVAQGQSGDLDVKSFASVASFVIRLRRTLVGQRHFASNTTPFGLVPMVNEIDELVAIGRVKPTPTCLSRG